MDRDLVVYYTVYYVNTIFRYGVCFDVQFMSAKRVILFSIYGTENKFFSGFKI